MSEVQKLRQGKPRPDPDARIGWCAAKKLAFVGERKKNRCGTKKEIRFGDYEKKELILNGEYYPQCPMNLIF